MKVEQHRAKPAYPSAAQFAISVWVLGLAAAASIGASTALADKTHPATQPAPAKPAKPAKPESSAAVSKEKKPKKICYRSEMEEGIHDYQYSTISDNETLRTIVAQVYQDGFVVEKPDETDVEKISEGGREIIVFRQFELLCRKVAGANPSLQLPSWDDPLPSATNILLPQVYKKTTTIKTGDEMELGIHDYRYLTKAGETLKSIVAQFYGNGSVEEMPDGGESKVVPFDSAACCKKVTAANVSLKVDWEKPLPQGTKLLLPRVRMSDSGH